MTDISICIHEKNLTSFVLLSVAILTLTRWLLLPVCALWQSLVSAVPFQTLCTCLQIGLSDSYF